MSEILTNPNSAETLYCLIAKRGGPMVKVHGTAAYLVCFDNTEQAESAAFHAENQSDPVRYEIAKVDVQKAGKLAQDTGLVGLAIRCADGDWKLWNIGGRREARAARRRSR